MQYELNDIRAAFLSKNDVELSPKEVDMALLNVAGLLTKEMACHVDRADNTIKKTMCNLKEKTGFHKDKELVTWFFCKILGWDFAEFKRQVLSAVMIVVLCVGGYGVQDKYLRTTQRQNSAMVSICRFRGRNDDFNTYNNV